MARAVRTACRALLFAVFVQKQDHQPVAGGFVDITVVFVDGVHEDGEVLFDDRVGLLAAQLLAQAGVPLDVQKEDRQISFPAFRHDAGGGFFDHARDGDRHELAQVVLDALQQFHLAQGRLELDVLGFQVGVELLDLFEGAGVFDGNDQVVQQGHQQFPVIFTVRIAD